MPKHRVREALTSLFGSHIGSDKDKQIKDAKEDVDDKVAKILKLIKDEESEEKDESSLPNSKKELLALIEEFRDQYNTLYGHYDHLTGELSKKIHGKHGNDNSSSSSSDSESEHAVKGSGNKDGRLSDNIKLELEAAHQKIAALQKKLNVTNEEKENLIMEADTNRRAVEEGETTIADLRIMADTLKEENRAVISELEAVKGLLASAQQEAADLSHTHKSSVEENKSLILQLSELSDELNKAKSTIEEMMAETSQVKEKLGDREIVLSTLSVAHETHKTEAANQITDLSAQVQSLELELNTLKAEKAELNARLYSKSTEIDQLTEQRSMLQAQVNELDTALGKVKGEHKIIEGLLEETQHNYQLLKSKTEEKINDLQGEIESKEGLIIDLEKQVEALKEDLEAKIDELSSLTENVRNIEVALRLRTQKLRITEQLLSENEGIHKTAAQQFIMKIKLLNEKVATLLADCSAKDDAFRKMFSYVSEKVHSTMLEVESVQSSFEEQFQKRMNSISEVAAELKVVKDWIAAANKQKSHMEEKLGSLHQQLQDTVSNESTLTDIINNLEAKLSAEEGEKEELTREADRLKQTISLSELLMKEKEDGILSLGKEKLEAIKQLCICIEYHRERSDYFMDLITKMRPVRVQRGGA